jgi:hypothetical protein
MYIAALLFYCAIFISLLYKLTRKPVPLSITELAPAYLFKVLMGCLYGYIYLHYYNGDDTWQLHRMSQDELQRLLHEPIAFIKDLGPAPSFEWAGGEFWPGVAVYIKSLENAGIIKTLAIFNILSRGNYYINVAFFNFILFWGHYWLFSMLVKEFPGKRKPLLLLIFFFPPLVFWLSGIRAEGVLLFFLTLTLIHFRRWLYEGKKTAILYACLGALGIFIFRMEILFVLIPGLVAWYIAVKYNRKPALVFLLVFGIGCLLFFATAWVSPAFNFPTIIVQRQYEFLALHGTRFQLDSLQPSITGFVRVLPQAVNNTFFRPFIWEAKGLLQIMTALEIMFCWLLVLLLVFRKEEKWKQFISSPLLMLFLFFGITVYIFIGYTIPFPGAIVRYKALPGLLLLTIPVICIKWRFTS